MTRYSVHISEASVHLNQFGSRSFTAKAPCFIPSFDHCGLMSGLTDAANTLTEAPINNGVTSLETRPSVEPPDNDIFPPNTPLAASTTSFLLGSLFSLGLWLVLNNSNIITAILHPTSWKDVAFNLPGVQLPLFLAAWAFFHWAEFAVTAGWNREKCSTSCK